MCLKSIVKKCCWKFATFIKSSNKNDNISVVIDVSDVHILEDEARV